MLSARLARCARRRRRRFCTTFSSGNSHTDTMLTVRACEWLRDRDDGARQRDERRAHRSRAGGRLHRQRRQRGRAGRPVVARARARSGADAARVGEPVPDAGRISARACETGDDVAGRRCPHDGRPLPQPVLRRAGWRRGRRSRAGPDRRTGRARTGLVGRVSTIDVTLVVRRRPFRRARGGVARRSSSRGSTRSDPTCWCAAPPSGRPVRLRVRVARARGRTPRDPGRLRDDARQPGRARRGGRRLRRADRAERRGHARGAPACGEPGARGWPPASRSERPRTRDTCRAGSARNVRSERTGASRAIELLLAKLARRRADGGRSRAGIGCRRRRRFRTSRR